jgi:putative ABC transport system substrate-binding protein
VGTLAKTTASEEGQLANGAKVVASLPTKDAQQSSGRVVGILSPLSPSAAASSPFAFFRKTLLDLGYVEGRSISFEYRWADGNSARLADFAAELVNLKVDVIFCGPGTPTAMAAKKATATIPIVFVGVGDAVGTGLVESLRRTAAMSRA